MTILIAFLLTRFLRIFRLPFVLSLTFYGGLTEYWAYVYNEYDLYVTVYIILLGLTLFIFGKVAENIKVDGNRKNLEAHTVMFLVMIFFALYFVKRDYGGLGAILKMDRATFYFMRQGGHPLFDVCLFAALSQAAMLLRIQRGIMLFAIFVPLVALILFLGDRRILLLVIFPLLYGVGRFTLSRKMAVILVGTLVVFIVTGLWRINNSLDLELLAKHDIAKILIPNEPWLVYGIFKDLCHGSVTFRYGLTYLEGIGLMLPDVLSNWNIEPLSKWYVRNWHHELWIKGNTMAFSVVAESYLNWGMLIIFGMLPLALISRLFGGLLRQIYGDLWPSIFSYWIFTLPRLSISNVLKDFSFLVLIWLGLLFIKNFLGYVRYSGKSFHSRNC